MHPAQQGESAANGGCAVRHAVWFPSELGHAEQLLGYQDASAWLTIDREHLREFCTRPTSIRNTWT